MDRSVGKAAMIIFSKSYMHLTTILSNITSVTAFIDLNICIRCMQNGGSNGCRKAFGLFSLKRKLEFANVAAIQIVDRSCLKPIVSLLNQR